MLDANPFQFEQLFELRDKHIKSPKNCNHKYNLSAINFFSNVWTHLGLFVFVLSTFD
jgi:hypothetical protein